MLPIPALLDEAARRWRIPTALLHALAWHESRWQQAHRTAERVGVLGVSVAGRSDAQKLASDLRYNINEGARQLYLCWNRAPILGNGRLEDGRNILESWFYALGRYGTGKEGAAGHVYANQVLDALASGGEGRFAKIAVTRPSPEKLAWGRSAPTGPPAPWHFGEVAPLPPASPVVNLKLPYVMQVWDSPDDFDGAGSCGPCAMIMLLGGLGKRQPKPVSILASYPHTNAWGGYIKEIDDAVCEPNSGAVHAKMLAYLKTDFPTAAVLYNEKATFARVKAELSAGRPVILGTRVTPAGHLMTARGYLSDGKRILVNDPAGNQTLTARRNSPDGELSPTGNRYWNGGGEGALYEWDALDVRWIMTVGPKPPDADNPEDG
ncbi:C39 family peptidase [Armatimonas sp.]|uniref:C39 family peptidase n=1 Tax=Armatimonas sp. TaxID=1872638 RepID=UPI003751648B